MPNFVLRLITQHIYYVPWSRLNAYCWLCVDCSLLLSCEATILSYPIVPMHFNYNLILFCIMPLIMILLHIVNSLITPCCVWCPMLYILHPTTDRSFLPSWSQWGYVTISLRTAEKRDRSIDSHQGSNFNLLFESWTGRHTSRVV